MRNGITRLIALALLCLSMEHGTADAQDGAGEVRFETWEVRVSTAAQLAAYQFEILDPEKRSTLTGLEGGTHRAFKKPPYYDSKALSRGRLVVAAFDVGEDLPSGDVVVARLHLMITGERDPDLEVRLVVAADAEGERLSNAKISLTKGMTK